MDNPPSEVLPPARRGAGADLLARLVGAAAAAARVARMYALLAASAALTIAVYVFRGGIPEREGELVLRVLVVAAAAAPPILLFLFGVSLKSLAELPERLRSMPREVGARADELRQLGEHARAARGRQTLRAGPLALWRLFRSRDLLTQYAAVVPLLRLPFLGWTFAAAVAAAFEIAIAAVLLVLLLLGA